MGNNKTRICDRCGEIIKGNITYKAKFGYIKIKRFFDFGQEEKRDNNYDCKYELCVNCMNDLKVWIKEG